MTIDRSLCESAMRVCACFNLRRASRAVTRLYDEVLERGGLRSTQFVVLVALRARGKPTLPRLAQALGLDRSTLTRNLQPLVRAGLVEVGPHGGGRIGMAKLTRKGERALEACVPLWKEAQGRFEGRIGSDRWHRMLAGLETISTLTGT